MAKANPNLTATKPKNVLTKPLQADFKELFKALGKGIGHTVTGKWDEIASDTVDALSAIGLATEPGELAFLLVRRSMTKAIFDLLGESANQLTEDAKVKSDALLEKFDFSLSAKEIHLDSKFLDRPAELPLIEDFKALFLKWLENLVVAKSIGVAIVDRLPSYFVYALNQEWRRNAKSYRPLVEALDTPFAKAGEREWSWRTYAAFLQRKVQEGVFDEPFGLKQIYVPLNAFYYEETKPNDFADDVTRAGHQRVRVVVSLQRELDNWLHNPNAQDALRVISGGPGSGKSSFARIFAAQVSEVGKAKLLFVPLHLIDPSKDLVEEVGRFVRDEGILVQNPLDPESPEPNLVIIFDGLDELSSQGKAAAETARAFVREVERTLERRNQQGVRLKVLISGRELVVQENESEFRRPRQVLTLLPYFLHWSSDEEPHLVRDSEQYDDPDELLRVDLREQWWKKYGTLSGKQYNGLPKELSREDLSEVTAQPLLNYLVALSYSRGKIDFRDDINLNAIYADLFSAVHERGYEKNRPYGPIRHMNLEDFCRVMEEVGLAAWHGDGRTTTVKEIEEHCRASGLGGLLDVFQEGAKAGVTRLLAAFFFRQYGQRPSGDPTFVFTHKSFGEYLTARRVVRAVERVIRELERRTGSPDEGWDDREALKHWVQICGPSPVSKYLHVYLLNEMRLRANSKLAQWQDRLSKLFGYMLRHGVPMEQLQIGTFKEAMFQSRNAEEALLVALNICARKTKRVSTIEFAEPTAFGAWLKRIQGQRSGSESVLAASCLSFLDLSGAILHMADLYGTDFGYSILREVQADFACFYSSNLANTELQGGSFLYADFQNANLESASLGDSNFRGAHLEQTRIDPASLKKIRQREEELRPSVRVSSKKKRSLG